MTIYFFEGFYVCLNEQKKSLPGISEKASYYCVDFIDKL